MRFWPFTIDRITTQLLQDIHADLHVLKAQGVRLLMAAADLKAAIARLETAAANIAEDIKRLKLQVVPGMTEAEVAEVQTLIDAAVAKIEGLAAETPDA